MYNIVYLASARNDLLSIADYISRTLLNEKATNDLIDTLGKSISQLAEFPFMYPVYKYSKSRKYKYHMLSVKGYLVFYVVYENTVEIHRVIYSKMNITDILE